MTPSNHLVRQHNPTRAVVALLMLFALLGSLLDPSSRAAEAASDTPLDLAAMALTPSDLESDGLDGYEIRAGGPSGSDADLSFQVGNWGDDSSGVTYVSDHLADAGYQRSYHFGLSLPDPADPRFATRAVAASINEFEDADGATESFEILDEMSADSPVVEQIELDAGIGEETIMVQQPEANKLVIAFRADRLVAYLSIYDYSDTPVDMAAEPVVSDILSLAERLLERINAGLDGDAPGLGNHALRLGNPEYDVPYEIGVDQYIRLDGEDLPFGWESPDESARRSEASGDAIDAYESTQRIEGADAVDPDLPYQLFWQTDIYRFEDDDAASEWLQDRSQRIEDVLPLDDGAEVRDVELIDDAAALGDESFAVAYVEDRPDDCGCTNQILRVHARVGAYVVDMSLGTQAESGVSFELFEAIAAAQVDCLTADSCLDHVVLSDFLASNNQKITSPKLTLRAADNSRATDRIGDLTRFGQALPRWR